MAITPIIRNISGKGVIKIPEQYRKARQILLYTDLIRASTNEYANFTWNPSRHFYAHVTFCIGEHVLMGYDVSFKRQVFNIFDNQDSQNLMAQICALENVLDSFVQYALASGFVYVKNNSIKDFPYNTFLPDTIRFFCYSNCALQLGLTALDLEQCQESDGEPSPPPPPPPPPSPVAPGTPIGVDEPYDGGNDNGDTVPDPLDVPDIPPPVECQEVTVTYSYDAVSEGSPPNRVENQTIRLFALIGDIRPSRDANNDPTIEIECQGLPEYDSCGEFQFRGVTTLIGGGLTVEFTNPTIDSVS